VALRSLGFGTRGRYIILDVYRREVLDPTQEHTNHIDPSTVRRDTSGGGGCESGGMGQGQSSEKDCMSGAQSRKGNWIVALILFLTITLGCRV